MATITEQVQTRNPVLEAIHAQTTALMSKPVPQTFRAAAAETSHKQVEDKKTLTDCNCFDAEVDYRSFVRKPEFLVKLGSLTVRNPLHLTSEQDKAHLGNKIKRARKDARKAYKSARKANKAARKARSRSDKIQSNAMAARREIREATNMARSAGRENNEADAAHVRAMRWASCVEREGHDVGARATGLLGRAEFVGQNSEFCDHHLV